MKTSQVFVSHTSDMAAYPLGRSFAQAAIDAVGRAGMASVDMRYFSARDGTPADYCRQRVRECEVYVAVVGFQYGSLVPHEAVSYTELEFHTATAVGIPRLVFMLDEDACPRDLADHDRALVEGFRQRLRGAGLVVRAFDSIGRLELEVFHALSDLLWSSSAEQHVTFGALLRQLRTASGLTQAELARMASLSTGSVSNLERGIAKTASKNAAERLAHALQLTGELNEAFQATAWGRISAGEFWLASMRSGALRTRLATSAPLQQSHTSVRLRKRPVPDKPLSPATVPRIWNVPTRNADFTGRDATLERLHEELAGDGKAVVLARALYGLGGVGKTQVALEYAHRFMADYDLVWWIPAEQPQAISLALADLAVRLGFRAHENASEAAATVLEQLRRGVVGRWLLIFDNAEDPDDLGPFMPTGLGHILITSRNQAWTRHAEPVEVDVFTAKESVSHLMRHVPGLSPDDAGRVSAAVGQLPLAVEQASAWLAATGMPALSYVGWLETHASSALGESKPSDYASPVVTTWNLSFDRLSEHSPAAVRLLQILAFASPEPISMNLLYSDEVNDLLLPLDETLSEKLMLGRVIRDISRFALIKVDQGSNSLQIHRLVQAVIRDQMTDEEQRETRHAVHKILIGARPRQGETDDPANWSTYDIIWPHLVPSRAEECEDPRTRQLLIDWVRYQWKCGEFDSALQLGYRLQSLWAQRLGPNHQQTLHLQFHIANVLRSRGRFTEARDVDTYVLERQRAVLGADHPHALTTAGGLGADLRALGYFKEALESDQVTYESFKEQFGGDTERTMAAAHNLACSLRLVGDYSAAIRLDQETLDRQRRALPEGHPNTLLSAASLAMDMRAAGAFRDSVGLLRDTLERYRAVLGDDMLETLRTAASLAVSLRKAGEQSEAMNLAQDTYESYLRRYGSDSPDTQSCALNLACDYAAVHDMPRALDLVTEVKTVHAAALGEDHPNTMVAANNLACYLRCLGRVTEALQLTEDSLRRMRLRLGDDHPLTLSAAVNLANCLGDSGDLTDAEALMSATLSQLREALTDEHPDTLVCRANLAVTLHEAGRVKEAEELRTQILDDFGRVLGPGHPDAAQLQKWQRINRDLESQQI
jgi:transcriptional regulator with XRE-family HTH domain